MTQTVNLTEYVQAFKTVKRFKNLFMFFILISVLFQVNSFVLQEFTSVLAPPEKTAAEEDATPVSSNPAPPEKSTAMELYEKVLFWALPVTKFAALACAVLLAISLMFAGALSLLGHGQGTSKLIGAFFWSVILLGMLIPWQQVYSSSQACGALFGAMELKQACDLFHLGDKTLANKVFFYGRFLAFPAAAFVVWLIVAFKFANGYRRLILAESSKPTSVGM